MKWMAVVFLICLAGIAYAQIGSTAIKLEAPEQIPAGNPWTLQAQVDHGVAGDQLSVILVNGLQAFEATLTLGTGGIALWEIGAGQIVQAGESLIIVRYKDLETRRSLHVLPLQVVSGDFFATANTLSAYGQGTSTLIVLPHDIHGNAPAEMNTAALNVQFPNGERAAYPVSYENGLGFATLTSRDLPGRVRVSLVLDELSMELELLQVAGPPDEVQLDITPRCVPNDGRDAVILEAVVLDAYGSPVMNGTLVTFIWEDGIGYGRTQAGRATLRLPTPTKTGPIAYRAASGMATSVIAVLRVIDATETICGGA